MLKMDHGGNVLELARHQGVDFREFIDFSANINPLGLPPEALRIIAENMDYLTHYPDDRNPKLLAALSDYCGVAPAEILPGNGATELLYFLLRFLQPQNVLLPLPTFSEFHRACRVVGIHYDNFPFIQADQGCWQFDWKGLMECLHKGHYDLVIFVNPNNPTGTLVDRAAFQSVVQLAQRKETRILLDESFIDFVPSHSWIPVFRENDSFFILRSLTKFYSIPGLRLGYLLASPKWIGQMIEKREPWQVNNIAQLLAEEFLKLKEYPRETRKLVEQERKCLTAGLQELMGLTAYPSSCNFLLVQLDASRGRVDELYAHLLNHRIIVRCCSHWPGLPENFFRIAVRSATENQILIDALRDF